MIHGRTQLHEFTRDDGSVCVIEFKRTPYDPGCTYGPAENCYPPEGGEIDEWEADGGKTILTAAEAARAEEEIDKLEWGGYDDYWGDDE